MTSKELRKELNQYIYGSIIEVEHNDYYYKIDYDYDEAEWDIESYYMNDQGEYEYNCLVWVDEKYEVIQHIYGGNKILGGHNE